MSQVIYFESLRSGLTRAANVRAPSTTKRCGMNCRHRPVDAGFGHCERLGGRHGPVRSGQRFVCDRWGKIKDEVVSA